jgi:hypothetical protein
MAAAAVMYKPVLGVMLAVIGMEMIVATMEVMDEGEW